MYQTGTGVMQNDDLALEMFQKAADQGYAQAQFRLGELYRKGIIVSRSETLAHEWYGKAAAAFRKASKPDRSVSQFHLGLLYQNGWGVPQDFSRAAEHYQNAAEEDHAQAVHELAKLYAHGKGVRWNPFKAKKLRQKAEALGYQEQNL